MCVWEWGEVKRKGGRGERERVICLLYNIYKNFSIVIGRSMVDKEKLRSVIDSKDSVWVGGG